MYKIVADTDIMYMWSVELLVKSLRLQQIENLSTNPPSAISYKKPNNYAFKYFLLLSEGFLLRALLKYSYPNLLVNS